MKRRCPKCKQELLLHAFCVERARPDGLAVYCRECQHKIYKAKAEKRQRRESVKRNLLEYITRNQII